MKDIDMKKNIFIILYFTIALILSDNAIGSETLVAKYQGNSFDPQFNAYIEYGAYRVTGVSNVLATIAITCENQDCAYSTCSIKKISLPDMGGDMYFDDATIESCWVKIENKKIVSWNISARRGFSPIIGLPWDIITVGNWSDLTIDAGGYCPDGARCSDQSVAGENKNNPGTWSLTSSDSDPIALIDPIASNLVAGSSIEADTDKLANRGVPVQGVAADGVARLLVRIPAKQAGDMMTVSVVNDQNQTSTSINEDGGLVDLNDQDAQQSSTITVMAVPTKSAGPMAFVVYTAPLNFSRGEQDNPLIRRDVTLNVTSNSSGWQSTDVKIVRPPVVLVHGLWGDNTDWNNFTPQNTDSLLSHIYIEKANYGVSVTKPVETSDPPYPNAIDNLQNLNLFMASSLGFEYNAPIVLAQINSYIAKFRSIYNVASIQSDIVAHSMGGLVSRTMFLLPNFKNNNNFGKGPIHKLITIGTPHLGSPLATQLLYAGAPAPNNTDNSCVADSFSITGKFVLDSVTFKDGTTTHGGVGDLRDDNGQGVMSSALRNIQNSAETFPTAFISGTMSLNNLNELDACSRARAEYRVCSGYSACSTALVDMKNACWNAGAAISLTCSNDPLAQRLTSENHLASDPQNGWPAVFGQDSDAIVPLNSQSNNKDTLLVSPGVIHSAGTTQLGFIGPGELDEASNIPAMVIDLLNENIDGPNFQ